MTVPAGRIAVMRRFNRFYRQHIGALDDGMLCSDFSLTEVRVMFELAYGPVTTAKDLRQRLGLDAGYLSRILQRFYRNGFLLREISLQDRRELQLELTPAGRAVFASLDDAASREVARLLQSLDERDQQILLEAMQTIMQLLAEGPAG